MTVANLVTQQVYTGNGVLTQFTIPFDLDDKTVAQVHLINTLVVDASTPSGFSETLQVETTNFVFDVAIPPTYITMNIAPISTNNLRIRRISPRTQPDDLVAGTDSNEVIESRLDKVIHIIQEQDQRLADEVAIINNALGPSAVATASSMPDWATATAYLEDQVVIEAFKMYRALSDHTSNAFSSDLIGGKWELLKTSGIKGLQGDKGDDGDVSTVPGPPGTNGTNGNNGLDGAITALATLGDAQSGVENTKGMTPLRTKQAIDFQVNPTRIDTNISDITAINTAISILTTRMIALEDAVNVAHGRFSGKQIIVNGQAAPLALLGSAAPLNTGSGVGLSRPSSNASFAKVTVAIIRKTDTGDRATSFDLIMQFTGGIWLIGREDTTQLDDTLDLDGVLLTVVTDGGGIGQVSYTADTMAGLNHDTQSTIVWVGQEIRNL